ncbi:Protein of unknown function [Gryllus bimaculatus]|nr:Protein of unknown function [Gryllus bimaculatus]
MAIEGSVALMRSQMTLKLTDDGPFTLSLSRPRVNVMFLSTMETGKSCPSSRNVMLPFSVGSPMMGKVPITPPTGKSSLTKNTSAERPFSKKHLASATTIS